MQHPSKSAPYFCWHQLPTTGLPVSCSNLADSCAHEPHSQSTVQPQRSLQTLTNPTSPPDRPCKEHYVVPSTHGLPQTHSTPDLQYLPAISAMGGLPAYCKETCSIQWNFYSGPNLIGGLSITQMDKSRRIKLLELASFGTFPKVFISLDLFAAY